MKIAYSRGCSVPNDGPTAAQLATSAQLQAAGDIARLLTTAPGRKSPDRGGVTGVTSLPVRVILTVLNLHSDVLSNLDNSKIIKANYANPRFNCKF